MLRKSRTRAIKALFGSALLLALPFTTGCQTGNFGGNIPGYGTIAGWWGGGDAAKNDPSKPPAGYQPNLPSSKADPNGHSYAGAGQGRGARGGYGADGGGYESAGSGYGAAGGYGAGAQGPSYAAGNRNNLNNWGDKANRRASASSYSAETEGEFAGASGSGNSSPYGASARNEKPTPGYDPYGGATPSDEDYGASPRGSAYTADARGAAGGRSSPYSTRTVSGNQRAGRSASVEEEGYESEQTAPAGGSRFSSREDAAPVRGGRSSAAEVEDDGAMTADEDVEANYPQTKGYGSGYKVPSTRGATPPTERRYPSTKSGGVSSRTTDADYGMNESEAVGPETDGVESEEAAVEKVATSEPTRYGLSSKAAAMLDRGLDGDFRPGSTGRPGYRTAAKVAPAGYEAEETEEDTTTGRTASRFAE